MFKKILIANRGEIVCRAIISPALVRTFAALLLAAGTALPAQACSVLSPRLEREAAEAKEEALAEADKVVVGEWTFQPDEDEKMYSRWGTITFKHKGKRPPKTFLVLTPQDLNCGFAIYPSDDGSGQPQFGRFYLKRERGQDYFKLIHFESIERRN